MKAINDNRGTPIAKGLKVLLHMAMVIMIIAIVLFIICGFILTSENAISADILAQLEDAKSDVGPNKAPIVFFGGAIIAAIWLYVLNILRKIIGTLLGGDPFVPANISRLRTIWIVIVLSEIIRIIIVNVSSTDEMLVDIQAGTIFLVFVIAALSEVFRHGTELRRDAELTI